jgi:hypothetical protein
MKMANITVKFTDENAAFEDNGVNEYGYVMTQVMDHLYDNETGKFIIRDSNGNSIGTVEIK